MAESGSNLLFSLLVNLMPFVSILLLILAGLVSTVLTDVLAVTLMSAWPADIDATGNYFLYNVLPASIVVGVLVGLVFGRVMRRVSFAVGLVYVGVYVASQFALLSELLNPMADRLNYLAISLAVSLLVIIWRRAGT